MKTWTVTTHQNQEIQISGTRAELDQSGSRVTFYDEEDVVASFVGVNNFYLNPAE